MVGLVFGQENAIVLGLFQYVQQPVEATLTALLAVSLTYGGIRLLLRRRDLRTYVFLGTTIVALLGAGPWLLGSNSGLHELASQLRAEVSQVFAAGAARALLLGVALGATATGLRILLGADRPYGD
jgi:H+/Cl- antiporter ClcA